MSKAIDFPFSAVAGQDTLKLALILSAIDPAMGGVLISGPRGSAKSTLARGLADLLSGAEQGFVTLPLGATEEMLTGSLDLQKVLEDQQVVFNPGLLAKAHKGVLYLDEVNLLPDHLVDLLLDVAASGHNRVERDGLSHEHPAQFLLIGTMNPDEGELRPQLLDRFGLMVNMDNHHTLEQRMAVVTRRQMFEADPEGFVEHYAAKQEALITAIQVAQGRLATVQMPEERHRDIALRCEAANVEGLRADIFWYRAAMAHAAWLDEELVSASSVDAVEELVLGHRRKPSGSGGPDGKELDRAGRAKGGKKDGNDEKTREKNSAESKLDSAYSRPEKTQPSQRQLSESTLSNENTGNTQQATSCGDWGEMQAETVEKLSPLVSSPLFLKGEKDIGSPKDPNAFRCHSLPLNAYGRVCGDALKGQFRGKKSQRKVDWFRTLAANKGVWPLQQLRWQKQKTAGNVLHLVLLDTSGSTLQNQLLAPAKGVVQAIAEQAYVARERLTILGFGNQRVVDVFSDNKAPKNISRLLNTLKAGGGTPLREVLLQAQMLLQKALKQGSTVQLRTYLITDGRSRQQVEDIRLPGTLWVVDTEVADVKRGRCSSLAKALDGIYFPLNHNDNGALLA